MRLLLGPQYVKAKEIDFPEAQLGYIYLDGFSAAGIQTRQEIIDHAAKELAVRCAIIDPWLASKEHSRRDLISSLVFAAAALAGMRPFHEARLR